MKYESRQRVRPKSRHLAPLDVCLKNEFMEDEKCHNLMTWLICTLDYHNGPKFLDRQILKEQSDQGLHCLPLHTSGNNNHKEVLS